MNYVMINCSWQTVFVTVSEEEKLLYYSSSKLEDSYHKEQNIKIASNLAKECLDYLKFNNLTRVPIIVNGPQADVIKAFIDEFMNNEIELMYIKNITPISHDGCITPGTRDRVSKVKKLTIGEKTNPIVTK